MKTDEDRFEFERLTRLGRTAPDDPTPRQATAARHMDPGAWSEHADEQIAWCRRNGLIGSSSHFGALFMMRRKLSLMRADAMLRDLDREEAGLPGLTAFDARAMHRALEAAWWKQHHADTRRWRSKKAVDAVFLMRSCDGIPAPVATMDEADAAVTLTWTEGDHAATLRIDPDAGMTLHVGAEEPKAIDLAGWRTEGPRLLAEAADWVHHGVSRPEIDQDTAAAA